MWSLNTQPHSEKRLWVLHTTVCGAIVDVLVLASVASENVAVILLLMLPCVDTFLCPFLPAMVIGHKESRNVLGKLRLTLTGIMGKMRRSWSFKF